MTQSRALAEVPPTVRIWLLLAAYCGLRAAEIAGLSREDIDVPPGFLRVRGKGDKTRLVPLPPLVRDALVEFGLPTGGPLFLRADGTLETPKRVSEIASRWLHKLGVRVGGTPATIHESRHRYASEVYQATHDLRAVQELLGHERPATTAIYTAPDDAATLAAVISLSERLAQPAKPAERPPPGLTRAPDPTVLPAGRDAALDTAAGLIEASMGEADYHPFRDTVLDSLDRPELLELARVLVHYASAWLGFWVVERVEDTQAAFDAEVAREVALIRYAATLDPSSGGGQE